jgi:HemY protein
MHLHGIAPRHDFVTMLLARAYHELKDWQALVEILPDVRRKKLIKEAKLVEMEVAGYCGILELATSSQSSFENAWRKIPKALQADARMIHLYLDLMAEQGWQNNSAEQLILKSLDKQWNDDLIEVYGRFQAKDANAQLARVEKWLNDFGHNENLLLALGRIAMRARLWGKAQGYLEASIGARATPAACLALAELFEQQLQQPARAAEYYQQGLKLSLASSG